MKKQYSPLKKYHLVKRPKIFHRIINFLVKPFYINEVIWNTCIPKENVVFVANHTRTYAPLAFHFNIKRSYRPWVNAYTLTFRNGFKLFYNKTASNYKPKFLRFLALLILTPLINLYLRGLDPIPVYYDTRLKKTFDKSIETLRENYDIVIYPEKNTPPAHKYVNDMNTGFVHLAQHYYKETGKRLKFYPVYCAQSLKKILIGDAIEYNPDINIKVQRQQIVDYIISKINELGDSLPKHKIHYNKTYPEDINNFKF